ncbi:MAG: DUF2723 domain-containing protein [Ignavibacteriales bacterium]|nr:DUF2723 domain-containing protein [Ignavibacteriales bacterium]
MNLGGFLSRSAFHYSLLAAILGAVYFFTLLPGPGYSGDTAKFQFVGRVLGTPHETGYPTYVLLNHFFTTVFPFGSTAFKSNLLSAIFSVLACLLLFKTLLLLRIDKQVTFVCSLTFGLGYTVWSQSVVAEVYTLNLLFFSVVVYGLLRWHLQRDTKLFLLGCAAYAFSFGNHLTMITFLPAVVYIVLATDRGVFVDFRKIGFVAFFIVLGAAQYWYIFWRTGDPTTPYLEMSASDLPTFWSYISGGNFKHLLFGFSLWWMISERLPQLAIYVFRELLFLAPVVAYGFKGFPIRRVNTFFLIAMGGNVLFTMGYAILDIFVYLIPTYFLLTIYCAHGLQKSVSVLRMRAPRLVLPILLFIPLVFTYLNFAPANQRENVRGDNNAREALRHVRQDAFLVCPDYNYAMFLWYHTLAGEWENHNIHVVFNHDKTVPYKDVRNYFHKGSSFTVLVSRDTVRAGLAGYLFLDYYEWSEDHLLERKALDAEILGRALSDKLNRHRAQFSNVGIDLVHVTGYLYKLVPHKPTP